jgi:hypothetical protein
MKALVVVALISVILGGVLLGSIFGLGVLQPKSNVQTSAIPEYVTVTNIEFCVGENGSILVTARNIGITAVSVVKVLLNNVKQNQTYPSLPLTISPDESVVLNIITCVDTSVNYEIGLMTSTGNLFSESSRVPVTDRAGVQLYNANVNFYSQNGKKIAIDIGNSGTSDTHITALYIGTSSATLQSQPMTALSVPAGGIGQIIINYDWTDGETYYFRVVPQTGSPLSWQEKA